MPLYQRMRLPSHRFWLLSWYAAIAALAGWGLLLHIEGNLDNLSYFTHQSNLLVAAYYTWLVLQPLRGRGHDPVRERPGVHGAIVVYIIVTGVVYATVLDGSYTELRDVLSHGLVPILVTADWLLLHGGRRTLRAWHPLSWLGYPVAYLCFVLLRAEFLGTGRGDAASGNMVSSAAGRSENRYLYPFLDLDVRTGGEVALTVVEFVAGFAALGYLLLAWNRKGPNLSNGRPIRGKSG